MSKETFRLKKHQKCIDLLDMAIKAKNEVIENNRLAENYDNSPIENWYKSLYTANDFKKRAERYQPIYERIMKSYYNQMDILNSVN